MAGLVFKKKFGRLALFWPFFFINWHSQGIFTILMCYNVNVEPESNLSEFVYRY